MRRFGFALAFLCGAGGLAIGCFQTGEVFLPNGAECDGGTSAGIEACEGKACLVPVVNGNDQSTKGFCSKVCNLDDDCTAHERCLSIPMQGAFCFRGCLSDADCYDSLVCRLIVGGGQRGYCILDP